MTDNHEQPDDTDPVITTLRKLAEYLAADHNPHLRDGQQAPWGTARASAWEDARKRAVALTYSAMLARVCDLDVPPPRPPDGPPCLTVLDLDGDAS